MFSNITMQGLEFLVLLFIFVIGVGAAAVVVLYLLDAGQSRDAIRHNYPVVGRFRYLFTRLGEFFRQYFFALDREELPFNRAQRGWIYNSSRGRNNNAPFGSTLQLHVPGTPIFVNCAFPKLTEETQDAPPVIFGPYTDNPYSCASIINISAMSYGSISKPAVRSLSRGAKLARCWLNTGEGGLAKYHLEGGCDIVFQIGTAKYGVRDASGRLSEDKLRKVAGHGEVKLIELKLSQGAKPGKGGLLPGVKVTSEVARIRGIPKGKDSISPNRHPEIDSVDDLLDHIGHIRRLTGKPTGFKTVIGAYEWLDELCDAIERRGLEAAPDFITVDGGDGGTGAAPMSLMDNVGLPLRLALPVVVDTLVRRGMRDRVRLIASGKLVTPAEIAWAYCAGADTVNSARGFMFAIGCIQAMRCHRNTCPTGITTHRKSLQGALKPVEKSVRVMNYVEKVRKDVAMIAHSCGAPHARALKRHHVRMVQGDGLSVGLDELFPPPRQETVRA